MTEPPDAPAIAVDPESADTTAPRPPRIAVQGNDERHGDWHATLALADAFNEALQPMVGHVLTGMALPERDRELLILRRAWLTRTAYQWVSHVRAARAAGLTDDEIERVTHGPGHGEWSADDRDVLNASDELVRDGRLSDATWNALAVRYDHRQLVELPLFVGAYALLGYAQATLRVRPAIPPDRLTELLPFD